MLFVGTQTNDPNKRIEVDFDGLLHHTLIVGQSGSGKSFLVARIIEEILVRSRARILVIDPNGDFRRISTPSEDVWSKFSETFQKLDSLTAREGIQSFDQVGAFRPAWEKRRFVYLSPHRSTQASFGDATNHRLLVHWDTLDADQRSFLLNASSSTEPKVFLGLKAVTENAQWVSQNRPDVGVRMDLRGLLEVARQFAESNLGLREYEYAKILTRDDWYAVQAKIDDLLSQYSIWWSALERGLARPPGLADFIDGAFGDVPNLTYWDALVLSLEAAPPADSLLSADVALSRLWLRTKNEWRRRAENLQQDSLAADRRVPTFIVVDEAHNFAPDETTDPLRSRVTARLMQIASEGRKYGLYLVLASQRPTKLHRELVAECENACVLRLQSKIETDFAVNVLGLSTAEAHGVPSFTKGQGVFFGRWVGGTAQMNTKIAPARIVVGGGEIGSDWKYTPIATPMVTDQIVAVAKFVESTLRTSEAPIDLATLAGRIRTKFGERETLHWFGLGTFKEFLLSLNIDKFEVSAVPPGSAYLVDIHERPMMEMRPIAEVTLEGEMTTATVKGQLGAPALSRDEFRFLFELISEEVQVNEFNLTDTSRTVRDRCIASGKSIGRNAVNFVLKLMHFAGHRFDADIVQTPSVLADAFVRGILLSLERCQVDISSEMRNSIRRFYSGGLLEPLDSSSGSTDQVFDGQSSEREPMQGLADVPLGIRNSL